MYLKTYYQIGDSTCGISSLKTLMYYYSKGKIDLIYEDINHSSYSLKELKDIGESYGFNLEGVFYNDISKLKEKSIILLEEDDIRHYVFFVKRKKDKYVVIDPSVGEISIEKDRFNEIFKGYALIYQSKNNIKKIKKNYSLLDFFLAISEVLLSIPLIILLTSFFKDMYLSFALLIVYWILFFIKKFLLFNLMKKYDNEVEKIIKDKKEIDEKNIIKLYEYKTSKFTIFSKYYGFILINLCFIIVLSFLKYGSVLGTIFLSLNFIELRIININKKHIKEIYRLNRCKNNEKYIEINKISTKFVKNIEISKLISILLFSIVLIIYKFLFNLDLSITLGILVSSIFIITQNSLYYLRKEFKNYQIGKTIYESLKRKIN